MSKLLHDTAIRAMQEAHAAFMEGDRKGYREKMEEAERAIGAIRALGITGDNGREMELLELGGEKTLTSTLPLLRYPGRLLEMYSLAAVQMVIPPSRVFLREAPYLPPCDDVFAFYQVPLDKAEQLGRELTQAVALYGTLTNGGGAGTDLLFRAGLRLRQSRPKEALSLAREAMAIGGQWLQRPGAYLLGQIKKEGNL